MWVVWALVALERPVGHAMSCDVLASEQADARGRADRRGVGLGELYALGRKPFHIRRAVTTIECGDLVVERNGCVLPTHVVDQKDDEVGTIGSTEFACRKHERG